MDVWDGKSIEVRGIESTTTDYAIKLFFDSKPRSGGGAVEAMQRNTDNNVTYVTFKDPQG